MQNQNIFDEIVESIMGSINNKEEENSLAVISLIKNELNENDSSVIEEIDMSETYNITKQHNKCIELVEQILKKLESCDKSILNALNMNIKRIIESVLITMEENNNSANSLPHKLAKKYLEIAVQLRIDRCRCDCTETGEEKYRNFPKFNDLHTITMLLLEDLKDPKTAKIVVIDMILSYVHFIGYIYNAVFLTNPRRLNDISCYTCNGKNVFRCILKDTILLNYTILNINNDIDLATSNMLKISNILSITNILLNEIKDIDIAIIPNNKILQTLSECDDIIDEILRNSIICICNDYLKFLTMIKSVLSRLVECFSYLQKANIKIDINSHLLYVLSLFDKIEIPSNLDKLSSQSITINYNNNKHNGVIVKSKPSTTKYVIIGLKYVDGEFVTKCLKNNFITDCILFDSNDKTHVLLNITTDIRKQLSNVLHYFDIVKIRKLIETNSDNILKSHIEYNECTVVNNNNVISINKTKSNKLCYDIFEVDKDTNTVRDMNNIFITVNYITYLKQFISFITSDMFAQNDQSTKYLNKLYDVLMLVQCQYALRNKNVLSKTFDIFINSISLIGSNTRTEQQEGGRDHPPDDTNIDSDTLDGFNDVDSELNMLPSNTRCNKCNLHGSPPTENLYMTGGIYNILNENIDNRPNIFDNSMSDLNDDKSITDNSIKSTDVIETAQKHTFNLESIAEHFESDIENLNDITLNLDDNSDTSSLEHPQEGGGTRKLRRNEDTVRSNSKKEKKGSKKKNGSNKPKRPLNSYMKTVCELRKFLITEFKQMYDTINKTSCTISNDKEVVRLIAQIINEIKDKSKGEITYEVIKKEALKDIKDNAKFKERIKKLNFKK